MKECRNCKFYSNCDNKHDGWICGHWQESEEFQITFKIPEKVNYFDDACDWCNSDECEDCTFKSNYKGIHYEKVKDAAAQVNKLIESVFNGERWND